MNLFVLAIGAIVGSFLNVCIYRLPRGESIISPPSRCPNCESRIKWYDNVPVISYMVLKGKCRACGEKISARYILVELATALLFLALFIVFGPSAKFAAYAALGGSLIIATFVDFEIQEIPDEVSIFGLVVGLGFALAFPSLFGEAARFRAFWASLLGALVGGASIYIIGYLGELVFKKEAMGGGDVKLLAMIGSFLGWKLVIITFFVAPVFGSIVGVIFKIRDGRQTIPYGPYLSLAALISIFWGERILKLLFYGMY